MKFNFIILFFLLFKNVYSQQKKYTDYIVLDDDTIFVSKLNEIEVLEFKNKEDKRQYLNLKRKVIKVYPYAIIARNKINEINQAIDTVKKRKIKKKITKKIARDLKDKYEESLKKLTMSEGRILVKLIYRETKISSYEIVKNYRGKFNAFFWQFMAIIWKNDLKSQYNPLEDNEDKIIEHIIINEKLESKY